MSTEPLATYSERLLEVRREFALYDDRVVVRARWFPNRRFEHVVKLATLKRECQEITVRYRCIVMRAGSWYQGTGVCRLLLLRPGPARSRRLRGLGRRDLRRVLMALTYPHRRMRFARFPTRRSDRAGHRQRGNDVAAFEVRRPGPAQIR